MTQAISSLMDGELENPEADRAIRACCAGGEAAEAWRAYHLIGDVLRGNTPAHGGTVDRVRMALEQEPTVLAPRRMPVERVARIALAAAASIATVGVVGWIGMQGGAGVSLPVVAKSVSPVSLQPVATTVTVSPAPALDVQDYLAAHRQIPSPDLYRPVANRTPAPAR